MPQPQAMELNVQWRPHSAFVNETSFIRICVSNSIGSADSSLRNLIIKYLHSIQTNFDYTFFINQHINLPQIVILLLIQFSTVVYNLYVNQGWATIYPLCSLLMRWQLLTQQFNSITSIIELRKKKFFARSKMINNLSN